MIHVCPKGHLTMFRSCPACMSERRKPKTDKEARQTILEGAARARAARLAKRRAVKV